MSSFLTKPSARRPGVPLPVPLLVAMLVLRSSNAASGQLAPPARRSLDSASLQAAIDAAGPAGTVRIPTGYHVLRRPLNLRDKREFHLVGDGGAVLIPKFDPSFADSPVIDMTGAHNCSIRQLRIKGETGENRLALLLARNERGDSAGSHYFEQLAVDGAWTLACVVNIASEVNVWQACSFANDAPGGHAFWLTDVNSLQPPVRSLFGPIGKRENNNLGHLFAGCQFAVRGRTGRECNLVVQDTADLTLTGCFFSSKGSHPDHLSAVGREDGGLAAILSETVVSSINRGLTIIGCRAETQGARHFLYVRSPTADVTLFNNTLLASESVIRAEAPCDGWQVRGGFGACWAAYEWGGPVRALMSFTELSGSDIVWTSRYSQLARDARPGETRRFATVSVQILQRSENNAIRLRNPADYLSPGAATRPKP